MTGSSAEQDVMLCEIGLGPVWKLRDKAARHEEVPVVDVGIDNPASSTVRAEPVGARETDNNDRAAQIARMDWDQLKQSAADCRACELCKTRKQAVLGIGDTQADWLFVGEGPGAEEDEHGEPFVGQAGKLLDAMLNAIDLKRGKDVYIANSVKCRPPNNRTPAPEEILACQPYLQRQIALLQPKLMVALGKPAAQTLLGHEVKIGASRGQLFEHQCIPLIVTYHPAYLLRNLPDKAKSWEDLVFARRSMHILKSTKEN